MINLAEIGTTQPLVILRGEYGIIKGSDSIIASPNAKNGVVLILSDPENSITAMAHIDGEKNLETNLDKIISELALAGANIKNLKCKLVENEKSS